MVILQLVALPVFFVLALLAFIASRLRGRRGEATIAGWSMLVIIAAWLFCVCTAPPLGPHPLLLIVVAMIFGVLAITAIKDLTGYTVRTGRSFSHDKYDPSLRFRDYRGD